MYKLLIVLLFTHFSIGAVEYTEAAPSTINYLESYNVLGSGDVIFRINDPQTDCDNGYYIR